MAFGYQGYGRPPYYNTFSPMGYPQPQPTFVPQPQPQVQQPVYNESYIQGVQFVSEDEAKAYPVLPNQTVMLMNKDNQIFYIKSADSLGKSKIESFRFEAITEDTAPASTTAQQPIDLEGYVKKDDIATFGFATKDDIKALSDKLEKVQKQVKINEILGGASDDKENT